MPKRFHLPRKAKKAEKADFIAITRFMDTITYGRPLRGYRARYNSETGDYNIRRRLYPSCHNFMREDD